MMLLIFTFILLGTSYGSDFNEKSITFLNRSYTTSEWSAINEVIQCMSTKGEWVYKGKLSGMLYDRPCMWNRYVTGKCNVSELEDKMHGLDYVWQAHTNCSKGGINKILPIQWNRESMCRLLSNHNILMLGDSLQDEWFYSLTSSLIRSTFDHPEGKTWACSHDPKFMNAYRGIGGDVQYQIIDTSIFNCGNSKLYYVRHDHFFLSHKNAVYDRTVLTQEELYGAGWHELLDTDFDHVDLLVVNRGAHYVPDHVLLKEINETLTFMTQQYGSRISIIFRSTAPGHSNYDETRYLAPLRNSSEAKLNDFHWDDFERQNRLVQRLIRRYFKDVLYLDVYPSSVLRHDGHTDDDGLHYCIPGPIDNWTVLLYNALSILEQAHTLES